MAAAVGKGKEDDLDQAYEILGVEEDADDKQIQSAYRKLSLKCHPDRNPDDPTAADKFDQITRIKDHLLDPVTRAELDRKRKAGRDLEERFAQQDEKRRGLCKDLEGREAAAAAGRPRPRDAPSAAELRKQSAQADYAARLKAKREEVAERQSEVVAEVVQTRAMAEEARVRITWRCGGPPVSVEVLRKALMEFGLLNIEVSEGGAMAQLGSREDALRAILECRQRKHQLAFRVALATAKKAEAPADADPLKRTQSAPAANATKSELKRSQSAPASFDDWEAKMFAGLQNLAKRQKSAKS